jgi:hypothetical protein
VRVKPLAYWANQSICIDHKAGRAYAIDPGFPDQLTASAAGITLPGALPKLVSNPRRIISSLSGAFLILGGGAGGGKLPL